MTTEYRISDINCTPVRLDVSVCCTDPLFVVRLSVSIS